jgi:hypothetical protein
MLNRDRPVSRQLPEDLSVEPIYTVSCGHCYNELQYDGDGFPCRECGLYYGSHGSASLLDEDLPPCGARDPEPWTGIYEYSAWWRGGRLLVLTESRTCPLPKGHKTEEHLHSSGWDYAEGPIPADVDAAPNQSRFYRYEPKDS